MWLSGVASEVNVMCCSTTQRQKWEKLRTTKAEMQLGFDWAFVCLVCAVLF